MNAFRQGLKEAGFVEGQNVAIEFRSAEDQSDRLPALVADLIHRPVAVIVCNGIAALTAKAATTTVPIVFATGGGPGRVGPRRQFQPAGWQRHGGELYRGRAGGEATGVAAPARAQGDNNRRAPYPSEHNPKPRQSEGTCRQRPKPLGQQLIILDVGTDRDIEAALATLFSVEPVRCSSVPALSCSPIRDKLSRWRLAMGCRRAIALREFAAEGVLMSYGASVTDAYRQVGIYAGRILKGEKPAELPVMQSTKFELVINLKTAKTLGLEMPDRAARARRRGDRIEAADVRLLALSTTSRQSVRANVRFRGLKPTSTSAV